MAATFEAWVLVLAGGQRIGNWPTRAEAEAAILRDPLYAGAVAEPATIHNWRECPCRLCRGQREAHVYLTVPSRFTP